MKVENVHPNLIKYSLTYHDLHIPFLAIAQLYIAYYRGFISPIVNNKMGISWTFILLMKQFYIWLIFVFPLFAKQSFRVNPSSIPFIIIWGIIHVSFAQQFFVRSQIENGPFITAWYQPIVPALSTLGAMLYGYEKGTTLKYFGIVIWLGFTFSRFYFDSFYNVYESRREFEGKFFLIWNVLALSIGFLIQKQIVNANPNTSLFVMVFYIYLSALIFTLINYSSKFWIYNNIDLPQENIKETFHDYMGIDYFTSLSNLFMVFFFLALCETFRYLGLIHINKEGQISKVSLYGGLHGFYVVIFWIVFLETKYFDYIFLGAIILAYMALFFSKYRLSQILKIQDESNQKIRFVKHVSELENAERLLSITKIEIDGKYFYEASYQCTTVRGGLFNEMNSDIIRNSYYGGSPKNSERYLNDLSQKSKSGSKKLKSSFYINLTIFW